LFVPVSDAQRSPAGDIFGCAFCRIITAWNGDNLKLDRCPSCNVPLHDAESALAATNISSPLALCRKPIFFSALYHLTTPVVRPASAGVARTAIVNKTENVLNIALA
jgi:hypothetical protein